MCRRGGQGGGARGRDRRRGAHHGEEGRAAKTPLAGRARALCTHSVPHRLWRLAVEPAPSAALPSNLLPQNPTSTAIFKSLLTLKTRNALVRLLGLSLLALLPAALYVCHLGGLPVKASSCSHAWRLRLGLPALPLTATGLTPAQVLCPHPRAKKCTIEAARIVRDAAVAAGAPEGEGRCGRLCFGTGASFHNSWP